MKDMLKNTIQEMVEAIVVETVQEVLGDLIGTSKTQVAKAEIEKPAKKPVMTKEEFFALEEDEPKVHKDYSTLDFEPVSAKALKYNGYVPSDIWTINHLAITQKYGGKWSSKLRAYTFETHADAVNFAQSYKVKTVLDEADKHNIKVYKAARAKAKAEYYAKKAAENA